VVSGQLRSGFLHWWLAIDHCLLPGFSPSSTMKIRKEIGGLMIKERSTTGKFYAAFRRVTF
jgi:hypothetical protein